MFLGDIYDRITTNEIRMKDSNPTGGGGGGDMKRSSSSLDGKSRLVASGAVGGASSAAANGQTSELSSNSQMNGSLSSDEHSSEHSLIGTSERGSGSGSGRLFYLSSDADLSVIQPMFDLLWFPALATFSMILEESDLDTWIDLCMDGYRLSVKVSTEMELDTSRQAFVSSLRKFTLLGSSKEMKNKNLAAVKVLLTIAHQDGNRLKESWIDVLQCVSEVERLHLVGAARPDGDVFRSPPSSSASAASSAAAGRLRESDSVNSLAIHRIDASAIDRVFTGSANLDEKAIIDFVSALRQISEVELSNAQQPRVFALQKIVEITSYNMGRIRLVWNRIWAIISEYFIQAGTHPNLNVSIFAIDSVRQLAMKFLEKDELACFPTSDHQLLTARGFMSFDEVQAALHSYEGQLMVACPVQLSDGGYAIEYHAIDRARLTHGPARSLVEIRSELSSLHSEGAFMTDSEQIDLQLTSNHRLLARVGSAANMRQLKWRTPYLTAGALAAIADEEAVSFLCMPAAPIAPGHSRLSTRPFAVSLGLATLSIKKGIRTIQLAQPTPVWCVSVPTDDELIIVRRVVRGQCSRPTVVGNSFAFQKQFFKPFEAIMQHNPSPDTRELIVGCLQRMIATKVHNIKSGWKAVFVVLGIAARQNQPPLVHAAFDLLMQIMDQYFALITETADTLDECISCLVSFGCNELTDVAEKAIDKLEKVADYLGQLVLQQQQDGQVAAAAAAAATTAAGAARKLSVDARMDSNSSSQQPPLTAHSSSLAGMGGVQAPAVAAAVAVSSSSTTLRVWFYLLTGLSRLVGDSRLAIRSRALDSLFSVLNKHGHLFSAATWRHIFHGVLFPIFDDIRHHKGTAALLHRQSVATHQRQTQQRRADRHEESWYVCSSREGSTALRGGAIRPQLTNFWTIASPAADRRRRREGGVWRCQG